MDQNLHTIIADTPKLANTKELFERNLGAYRLIITTNHNLSFI
jgi:hypothetical protein